MTAPRFFTTAAPEAQLENYNRIRLVKSVGNLNIKIIEFFFLMSEDSIKFYIINYRKFHSGGSMLYLFGLL